MTRIAVDAMGGDYAPDEIVKGERFSKKEEIMKILNKIIAD